MGVCVQSFVIMVFRPQHKQDSFHSENLSWVVKRSLASSLRFRRLVAPLWGTVESRRETALATTGHLDSLHQGLLHTAAGASILGVPGAPLPCAPNSCPTVQCSPKQHLHPPNPAPPPPPPPCRRTLVCCGHTAVEFGVTISLAFSRSSQPAVSGALCRQPRTLVGFGINAPVWSGSHASTYLIICMHMHRLYHTVHAQRLESLEDWHRTIPMLYPGKQSAQPLSKRSLCLSKRNSPGGVLSPGVSTNLLDFGQFIVITTNITDKGIKGAFDTVAHCGASLDEARCGANAVRPVLPAVLQLLPEDLCQANAQGCQEVRVSRRHLQGGTPRSNPPHCHATAPVRDCSIPLVDSSECNCTSLRSSRRARLLTSQTGVVGHSLGTTPRSWISRGSDQNWTGNWSDGGMITQHSHLLGAGSIYPSVITYTVLQFCSTRGNGNLFTVTSRT